MSDTASVSISATIIILQELLEKETDEEVVKKVTSIIESLEEMLSERYEPENNAIIEGSDVL